MGAARMSAYDWGEGFTLELWSSHGVRATFGASGGNACGGLAGRRITSWRARSSLASAVSVRSAAEVYTTLSLPDDTKPQRFRYICHMICSTLIRRILRFFAVCIVFTLAPAARAQEFAAPQWP